MYCFSPCLSFKFSLKSLLFYQDLRYVKESTNNRETIYFKILFIGTPRKQQHPASGYFLCGFSDITTVFMFIWHWEYAPRCFQEPLTSEKPLCGKKALQTINRKRCFKRTFDWIVHCETKNVLLSTFIFTSIVHFNIGPIC